MRCGRLSVLAAVAAAAGLLVLAAASATPAAAATELAARNDEQQRRGDGSSTVAEQSGAVAGNASSLLEEVTSGERKRAEEYRRRCHNRPRYTFFTTDKQLTKQDSRFCLYSDPSSFETCDMPKYLESVVLIMVPVVGLAVVFIPVAIVYFLLRCCTCGRYQPTRSFCGGRSIKHDWEDGVDGYKSTTVLALRILAAVSCALGVLGCVLALAGSAEVTDQLEGAIAYGKRVRDAQLGVLDSTLDVVTQLAARFPDALDGDKIAEQVAAARAVGEEFGTVVDVLANYTPVVNEPREIAMYATMVVPAVLAALLLVASLLSVPSLACLVVVLSCVWLPPSLLSFGVHFPIGTVVSDLCYFLDEAADPTSPQHASFLGAIYDCNDSSPIGMLTTTLDKAVDSIASYFCSGAAKLCAAEVPCDADENGVIAGRSETCRLCNCSGAPAQCGAATLEATLRAIRVYDYYSTCFVGLANSTLVSTGNCTADTTAGGACPTGEQRAYCNGQSAPAVSVAACAADCASAEQRNASAQLQTYEDTADQIMGLVNNKIRPYLRCPSFVAIVDNMQDFLCVGFMNAVELLTGGSICVAVSALLSVVLGVLGSKRFNKKYRFKPNFSSAFDDTGVYNHKDVDYGGRDSAAVGTAAVGSVAMTHLSVEEEQDYDDQQQYNKAAELEPLSPRQYGANF